MSGVFTLNGMRKLFSSRGGKRDQKNAARAQHVAKTRSQNKTDNDDFDMFLKRFQTACQDRRDSLGQMITISAENWSLARQQRLVPEKNPDLKDAWDSAHASREKFVRETNVLLKRINDKAFSDTVNVLLKSLNFDLAYDGPYQSIAEFYDPENARDLRASFEQYLQNFKAQWKKTNTSDPIFHDEELEDEKEPDSASSVVDQGGSNVIDMEFDEDDEEDLL